MCEYCHLSIDNVCIIHILILLKRRRKHVLPNELTTNIQLSFIGKEIFHRFNKMSFLKILLIISGGCQNERILFNVCYIDGIGVI